MIAAPRQSFDAARRFAWLRLWRSENIGPRTFQSLLSRYGTAEAALDALPELIRKARPGRPIRIATVAEIEAEMATAEKLGARFVCRDEAGYPPLLREIDSPPAVIALRGQASVLEKPAIAIVGARNASAAGLAFAERLARGLAQSGYAIVSGFARGIDSRAHRASLASGTIAVLAGGHDKLYPADQGPFMDQVLEDGAALTEMPFGWEARGRDFPRRNRIVSGLSLGVIVVEAARRSGSLITARFAAEQGREVFAVPGSPLDPRAEGTNDLIRDGATFCADVDDVLRALADRTPRDDRLADAGKGDEPPLWDEMDLFAEPARQTAAPPDLFAEPPAAPPITLAEDGRPPRDKVVERLGPTPVSMDELARAADLSIREVRAVVLELEIAGRIERHGGGLVSLLMG
ncbi:DNA protecting protein DprA [Beijerinckiaceae bacterium RH AL1]|nr:DNA-processing protein DprA [Beijerinckiaceae bacterium]VVB45922.1 DNA protecting protein DprA [Beijerinckiaceae bacterium RH CH11]VVB46001.1 DNA protecting protein DprA [Beijerinckiaceae bacterium RH AL8]VVC55109.1 DNA protecting protein DprA [Beijerinckiaceae bacterium RH AL1]